MVWIKKFQCDTICFTFFLFLLQCCVTFPYDLYLCVVFPFPYLSLFLPLPFYRETKLATTCWAKSNSQSGRCWVCTPEMYDSHRWISELFITYVCLHLYVVTNALCVTINYEWQINVMPPITLNKNSGWHAHLTLICNFEVTNEKPTSHFIRYTL